MYTAGLGRFTQNVSSVIRNNFTITTQSELPIIKYDIPGCKSDVQMTKTELSMART